MTQKMPEQTPDVPAKAAEEIPTAAAAQVTKNPESRESIKKTGFTLLGAIALAILTFGFGNYFYQLSKSEEVRWTHEGIECLDSPNCSSGRLIINVYKLGGQPEAHARLEYAVLNPATHEVVASSLQKYDLSLFNKVFKPHKDRVGTFASLPADDPEKNPRTAIDCDLTQLEAGQAYELTIILRSNSSTFTNVGRFGIRNAAGKAIGFQSLRKRDWLRLYLVEAVVILSVLGVLVGLIVFGLIWKGRQLFAHLDFVFRLKRNSGG